jgi:MFS transporter, SP family, galactose:H+ symporter
MDTSTNKKNHFYVLILALIVSTSGVLFGFDIGIINGALKFIVKTFKITNTNNQLYELFGFLPIAATTLKGIIVSAVSAGAMLGAIISSIITYFLGRRSCVILTALLFVVGTLLATTAFNINILVIGRLIIGIAVGLTAVVTPMYLAEIAPPEIRGSIIFLFQLAITVGIFFAFIINYLFHAPENWRAMFGIGIIPAIALGIGAMFIPESPRWLMLKGHHTKAHHNLHKIRGHHLIEDELAAIKHCADNALHSFKILFSKQLRAPIIIILCLFAFQQLTGINTIFYYAPILFEAAGIQGTSAEMVAVIGTGGINILATIFGIWLIDHIGRRKLLHIGFTGIIVSQITLGCVYSYLFSEPWVCVAATLCFIAFYSLSLGGMAYVMLAELLPLKARSSGTALITFVSWGFNMIITATFLNLVNKLGFANTYWFYAILTTIGLLFVIMFVPETKHVTLEHIEKNLYAKIPSRHLGKIFEDA